MHSPEFEFNDSFYAMDFDTISCCDAGIVKIASNHGDMHILTTSPTIDPDSIGFFHNPIHTTNTAKRIVSGLFYIDRTVAALSDGENSFKFGPDRDENGDNKFFKSFLTYPWHRTGSLNNDFARPDNGGIRSAMLGQKKLTNLMFCEECLFYDGQQSLSPSTDGEIASDDDIRIFHSDQISLIKINGMNYYGNVDQVLTPPESYYIIGSKMDNFTGPLEYIADGDTFDFRLESFEVNTIRNTSSEPVYMKYKSTPHAIIHSREPISHATGD